MLTTDLRVEASRLLAELIAIDTTNPPGNETAAAEHLAAYLARSGVEAELVGRVPERANLIARIPGRGSGPSLLLLSHTDVVPAAPAEWSVPPFSGLDRDGCIWGRGALDMKGQVAAETVAFAALAREGWQGNGDLILCSVADEEVGAGFGAKWLAEEHPDLIRCDYVVNEGGGERVEHRDRIAYTINVGEKMCSGFAITVHGRSGHGSTPHLADNPVPRLAPVIDRIDRMARPARDLPELRAFLRAIGEDGADPVELAERARQDGSPVVAGLIPPMLGAVITPTGLEGSTSLNVIPGQARLLCDCRIVPGQSPEEIRTAVETALEGIEHDFEFLEQEGGTASPSESPLWDALDAFVGTIEPDAVAVPTISTGFTDSHFLREALGCVAYGFSPLRADPLASAALVHSADERISKDDLALGVECYMQVARDIGALA
ncbi:MAG TPA: M20/M25/M40 family metallo-hydrolase [Gaiellales bacterium]|jgi:acetylornithine deacetylase/succinyl-diaminopimelate desuccinylase-like protein|nr:M20/M25/M40 family metallo-hydrolase [Gaiellales bacterium]